ncbi:hypothetical protein QBC44DRAFT_369897 [Cladorrhinum sp. PSN332]|nr:hypothetical protein QBC44DRAFT_369897 [Cladorrhinum sp. PSN332]
MSTPQQPQLPSRNSPKTMTPVMLDRYLQQLPSDEPIIYSHYVCQASKPKSAPSIVASTYAIDASKKVADFDRIFNHCT